MSFEVEVEVEVPVEELKGFVGDVEQAIHEWKLGILDYIRRESTVYSRRLASARMPKGGSYIRRIKWRDLEKGPLDYVSELYNDHKWAMAVEKGTRKHPIRSEKLMTAYPMLAKKGIAQEYGTRGYGTTYGARKAKSREFQHPGSRAFWIFRDTARHIEAILMVIIDRVAGRLRIR